MYDLLEIKKEKLLKLFDNNFIIEDLRGNMFLDRKFIEENFKNEIIFCNRIDYSIKLIVIY